MGNALSVSWAILSTLTLSRQNVRSLMNGMKEKAMLMGTLFPQRCAKKLANSN